MHNRSDLTSRSLPGYNWHQSYDWNYDHVPEIPKPDDLPNGNYEFCGLPVRSPLGIAAGPLLNGRWIRYYAALGFDVLTYKTVRSRARACYPMPNLQPISAARATGDEEPLPAGEEMRGSWAVSFGMPSKSPEVWRADIAATRKALPKQKLLSVSVVATPEPDWTLDDLAADFALCARWAVESGGDAIEANFSCPNVDSADAQLYQQPPAAGIVAGRIRAAIGLVPLLIKIGQVSETPLASQLVQAVTPYANALVMVNCIAARVKDLEQGLLFDGQKRGIAGAAIREPALEQIRLFARVLRQHSADLKLVGVGGIGTVADVREHLAAGSHSVQLATAAMLRPELGIEIRRELY